MPHIPQVLDIAQLGEPVLLSKAEHIEGLSGLSEVQDLIDDMMKTCLCEAGFGLSAPQVFQSKRVFVISSYPTEVYPNAERMELTACINPVIIRKSPAFEIDWEGCLSVPGIKGLVPRSQWIDVAYITRDGSAVQCTLSGLPARVFQHEFDHLEGTLFFQHVGRQDLFAESVFRKAIRERQRDTLAQNA